MRIPAGDLMPSRAHRRRRRRPSRRLVGRTVVVLALLAAVGVGTWKWRDRGTTSDAAPAVVCPTTAPAQPGLPAPAAVTVRLLNGTARDGLGAAVAADLTARGFVVGTPANAPAPNPGRARVGYAAADLPAAQLLAAQVLDADVAVDPAVVPGSVDLVLGDAFARLRTPEESAAVVAALAPPAAPRPAGC
ncbi:MAG: hypothetical protein JWL64_1825 [Frankiales bacterium]|nr:hypothetical protein [Frankiales bacterium]